MSTYLKDVLPEIYGRVLVPPAVLIELQHPDAPIGSASLGIPASLGEFTPHDPELHMIAVMQCTA
jgi:hypothetical protein